jgi:hypothetical protein
MIMQHFSRQQLLARWDKISDILREAIFSDINEKILDDIALASHLSDDQRADMAYLCLLVFLGFISYRDVMQELQERFNLDPKTALAMYQEIDEKLFEPIRKDIEDNYLKCKVGVVDEASVQKPTVTPEVNLKAPEFDEAVNLKKEDAGPKILSVGEPSAVTANGSVPPVPPLSNVAAGSGAFVAGTTVGQGDRATRSPVAPSAAPSGKDPFALSAKDLWGIESEDATASGRPSHQSPPSAHDDVSAASASVAHKPPVSVGGEPAARAMTIEEKKETLPAVEEPRLPEIMPQTPRPTAGQLPRVEEKKIAPPSAAARVSVPPSPQPEKKQPAEGDAGVHKTTPAINPNISVNVQINPQSFRVMEGAPVSYAPVAGGQVGAGGGVSVRPVSVEPFATAGSSPAAQSVRPMQWAAPAQPPRQPDVVVEIRQTQESQSASSNVSRFANQKNNSEPIPVRPMKVAPLAQSDTPPVERETKNITLAMHAVKVPTQQPAVKRPLNPDDVVDVGPVIIHKRDDSLAAHIHPGSQSDDLSSGGFSQRFTVPPPNQKPAPAVAAIQVPPSLASKARVVNFPVEGNGQLSAGESGQSSPLSAPPKKKGFFSFFKKS